MSHKYAQAPGDSNSTLLHQGSERQPDEMSRVVQNMSVHLQGILFHLTLYALSLTGLDLVFGVQWLEKLGAVVCDWSQMTMEFKWDGWLQ